MSTAPHIELLRINDALLLGMRRYDALEFIGDYFTRYGMPLASTTVVADEKNAIERPFKEAWERSDVLVVVGGLGPTAEGQVREVVADALGLPLEFDEVLEEAVSQRLGRQLLEEDKQQCYRPKGFEILPNRLSTAAGLFYKCNNKYLVLLPGPLPQLRPMFERQVVAHLKREGFLGKEQGYLQMRTFGVGEAVVARSLKPLFESAPGVKVSYYSHEEMVDIRLNAQSKDVSWADLQALGNACKEALGEDFVCFGQDTLGHAVFTQLREREQLLSVAESCTGGLLANVFTDIAGASKAFAGGVVCYNNDAKIEMLDVPESLLHQHGAVSAEVAVAMATGAAERFYSDYALSVTGYAGPTGGSDAPVGTIYLGYYSPTGVWSRKLFYEGDRADIKARIVNAALDWMRRELNEEYPEALPGGEVSA